MTPKRQNQESRPAAAEISFQKLYYSLLERKWIVLSCLAATVLLGVLYIIKTPKTYAATTVVQVEQSESKFVKIEDITTQDLKQAEVLKTIESNLSSSAVLLGIIEDLKLTPQQIGLSPRPEAPYSDNELVEALDKMVTVKLSRGTRLINITAENQSPSLAQQISDNVVKQYIRVNTAQRVGLSGEANKFLLEEADRLKRQVASAEQEAQTFKDEHPGVALQDSQTFIDQKLLALTGRFNESRQDRFKLESDYAQVRALLNGSIDGSKISQLLTITSVNNDPAVLQLEKSVADEEANIQNLAQRYKPKHPKFIQEQAQLAELKNALSRAVTKAAEAVGTSLETAKQIEEKFSGALKDLEQMKLDNDKLALPFNALMREVDANRELYDGVRMRLKETEVTRDIEQNDVRVVTPALLPIKPVKPKVPLVLAGSLMGGLLLGSCVSFAFSATDSSFKTVDEAEQALGLPALATVPLGEPNTQKTGLLILREPNGLVAEAFRTLRTSLSLTGKESERNTILFTSAVPGEGKSFCSVNHAVSLAQLGQRTLLIDGDLRLPTVGKTLFGKEPDLGVAAVLTGRASLDEALLAGEIPNLFILSAGQRVQNPAELLAGSAFGRLMKEAAAKFDRIVIDSAPVHAVSDTLLLVKHVQSVCMVIHAGKTPARAVERAAQILENANARPVGVVLNRMSQRNHGYYYYYSGGKYGKGVYGERAESSI